MEATKTFVEHPSGKLAVTVHAPRSLREEEAAFRELQEVGATNGIVYDRADSPAELVRLAQAKRYNCIFCDISVLDSVPYIHAIREIQVTPIIIGAIEECKNISIFSRYIKITDQAAAASRLAPIKVGDLRLYPEYRFSSIHEREITLTAKEFDILSLLASNPKRVFTYEMIVDLVWHEDYTFYLSLSRKRQASTACWFSRQKRQNW